MGAARTMTSLKRQMLRNRPKMKKIPGKPEVDNLFMWHIKKDDVVEVNRGKESGLRGRVLDRDWEHNTVTVDGVNLQHKEELDDESMNIFSADWKTVGTPQPLHMSRVSLIDPSTDRATAVVWRKRQGHMARVSVATGEVVPLPVTPPDDGVPRRYDEETVTRRAAVLDVTYVPPPEPSLRTRIAAPAMAAAATGERATASHMEEDMSGADAGANQNADAATPEQLRDRQ